MLRFMVQDPPLCTVLRIRIRDPVPFWPRDPEGVESQHPDPGSGMNNPDHIFQSLETIFLVFLRLKFLISLMWIRDPGWRQFRSGIRDEKKSFPGSGINIPDPQHWLCSSTALYHSAYCRSRAAGGLHPAADPETELPGQRGGAHPHHAATAQREAQRRAYQAPHVPRAKPKG